MSENGQASVGQILREAREAQGITLENAAIRLYLMQRQIEAMETDDFDSLGQLVFARGFVRNYARLLGLAPEPLLARMEGAPAEPAAVSHAAAVPPHSWLTSPWVILLLLGVLLAVAVPVALYWWLNSGVDEVQPKRVPAVQSRPAPVPAPVAAPAPAAALPAAAPPALPLAPVVPAVPAVAPAEPAEAAAPATLAAPAVSGALHLEFGTEAWAEIKDARGQMLLRKLNPAGSSVDIQGQPPFDMVIGNAAQAKMTYNGRPVDLKPHIDATVARFTLE